MQHKPNSVRRPLLQVPWRSFISRCEGHSVPAVAANRPPADATITRGSPAKAERAGNPTLCFVLHRRGFSSTHPHGWAGGLLPRLFTLTWPPSRETRRYLFCDTIRHLPACTGRCPPFRTACRLVVFGLSSAGKGVAGSDRLPPSKIALKVPGVEWSLEFGVGRARRQSSHGDHGGPRRPRRKKVWSLEAHPESPGRCQASGLWIMFSGG